MKIVNRKHNVALNLLMIFLLTNSVLLAKEANNQFNESIKTKHKLSKSLNFSSSFLSPSPTFPFLQMQKFTGAELSSSAIGSPLAISGNTIIVADKDGSKISAIKRRSDGRWYLITTTLITDNSDELSSFAEKRIAIDGNTAVLGIPFHRPDGTTRLGAVYIFEKDQGGVNNWGISKKILALDGADDDRFGWSVDIFGDTIVVGAPGDDQTGITQGSTYIFKRDEGGTNNWGEVRKIKATRPYPLFQGTNVTSFGSSVSISGDRIAVGSMFELNSMSKTIGAAYIFEKDFGGTDNWGNIASVTASDDLGGTTPVEFLYYGESVSLDGDDLIVGASHYDGVIDDEPGAAYIYNRNFGGTDNWGEVVKLVGSDSANGDRFGQSVDIEGDYAIVGADLHDSLGSQSGAAYLFERNSGGTNNWGECKKITPHDGEVNFFFGNDVNISGENIAIGAPVTVNPNNSSGSIYIFGNPTLKNLRKMLRRLHEEGSLTGRQFRDLRERLNLARDFINAGENEQAKIQLVSFITDVNNLVSVSVLTAREGQLLTDAADQIIINIS